jgi:hypothetical protein
VDVRFLAIALLVAGCYAPSHEDCSIACGPGGACPSGTVCRSPGYCYASAESEMCANGPPDALLGGDGALADARSDSPLPAIDGAPDSLVDAIDCPGDYTTTSGGSRYRVPSGETDWLPAQQDCADDGAGTHLAIPDSQAENDFLRALATSTVGDKKVWIGITDRITETEFETVTGDPVVGGRFTNWYTDEPSGEDCAILWRDEHLGRWHAIACSDGSFKQNYICECDGRPSDPSAY